MHPTVSLLRSALAVLLLASLFGVASRAAPVEVDADVIWDDNDARRKCPGLCEAKSLYWAETWRKVGFVTRDVCVCDSSRPPRPERPPAGLVILPVQTGGGAALAISPIVRYERSDFVFNDLERVSTNNFDECGSQCLSDRRCVAFTYSSAGSCYKKSGVGTIRSSPFATSGFVAARGAPPPQPGAPSGTPPPAWPGGEPYTRLENADLPDNDLAGSAGPANSFEDCARRCMDDERCAALTFNKNSHQCWPKARAGRPQATNNATSAIMSTRGDHVPHPAQQNACSVGGTARCPGCSVSCQAQERQVCTPPIEGVGGVCQRDADCRCAPR